MKRLIAFCGLLLISYTSISSYASDSNSFDFNELKEKLVSSKAKLVEDGLRLLPSEYLANYTLMRKSSSIQNATDMNPRALLFGDTGQLVLSFNGEKSQAGFAAIETAEFDRQTKRIYFREILFKGSAKQETFGAVNDLLPDEIDFENNNVVISKPNPTKCIMCHTDNPYDQAKDLEKPGEQRIARYIWSEYNEWRGAYGESDDSVPSSDEAFKQLKLAMAKNPRYSQLAQSSENSSFPYHNKENRSFSTLPNTRLALFLTMNYAEQVADLIANHPLFQKIKLSVYNFVLGCKSPSEIEQELSNKLQTDTEASKNLKADRGPISNTDLSDATRAFRKTLIALGWSFGNLRLTPLFTQYFISDPTLYNSGFSAAISTSKYGASMPIDFVLQALILKLPNVRARLDELIEQMNPSKKYYFLTGITESTRSRFLEMPNTYMVGGAYNQQATTVPTALSREFCPTFLKDDK